MNINISTLTPIHIGSGTEYQRNFEYIHFEDERKIALLDAQKVLGILGEQQLGHWISCIEQEKPLLPLIRQRKPDVRAVDVAFRQIRAENLPSKSVKAQIHTGVGVPIIPGSSIKGALRTAVWAEWILDNPKMVKSRRNLQNFRNVWDDSFLSKEVFGSDPNHDVFRLLQVGDVAFEGVETRAYEVNTINKMRNGWAIKDTLTQIVETITGEQPSSGRINHNGTLYKLVSGDYFPDTARNTVLDKLFPLVNQHTKRLIEEDIQYWNEKQDNPEPLGNYVEEMQQILAETTQCDKNSCILRLGWGSGFRAMTGDWHAEMTDNDYYSMVRSLRPKHPDNLVYPKSMRFIKGGKPLGFIKLKIPG